jgi:hypothetical protein
MLLSAAIAAAQEPAGAAAARKLELENEKLRLEIELLRKPPTPGWVSGVIGLVVGFITTTGAVLVARRNQLGALDQSVHDERLKTYPALVEATEPLAIYFPPQGSVGPLSPSQCMGIGRAMSGWYFTKGGLLLSEESRPAYFLLARALTRASLADRISGPVFPRDAELISEGSLNRYREELGFPDVPDDQYGVRERLLRAVDKLQRALRRRGRSVQGEGRRLSCGPAKAVDQWTFGRALSEQALPAERFRDYVFLQWLSSRLRTTLSEDLRSRRRPAR